MPPSSPLAAAQHQALALRSAGDLATARRMLAGAIESSRPAYGEDHPEVLGSAHLLARLHREADDPAAARRVLEEAYAAGERRWDPADPLMLALSFAHLLARLHREADDPAAARRVLEEAYAAGERRW
ncbi:tetratricopeptide repeat protein, partial [Micromonospora sp. ATA32]|nr:tetratricopeptide repeat protein [Micromonospora sp. ATA32]